jgi:cobalamin-dependent methionine synthase I
MPERNQELYDAIIRGDRKTVQAEVEKAIAGKQPVVDLMNESMIPAMREIGADGFGADANSAAASVEKVLGLA